MKSRKLANAIALALRKPYFLIPSFFLSLILLSGSVSAQSITIKGVVYDKLNKPLSDVTVEVVGIRRGTATDTMGRFSVTLDNNKQQLRFSHIGYVTQTASLNNSLSLEIFMDAEAGSQNEVVVIGYGKQRKISQIGAQSTVNVDDLKQPIANVSAGLAGRLGGLVAVQRQGEPGHDDADLWIRGIASLNDSRPLILIDGVERSMSNLNYDDIASFSILKDASATAVYGVRGANGVVLITTRQGKAGKPRFNFDFQEGITTFTRVPKMADGLTYMKMANEALTTRGGVPKYDQDYIDSTAAGKDPYLYPNVDWMNAVFKKRGSNRKVSMNVNGGSQAATYYVSLGYYDENGFFRSDPAQPYHSGIGYSRFNFTSNLNLRVTSSTALELGLQGYYSNGSYPGINVGFNPTDPNNTPSQSIFQSVMDMPPVELPLTYPGDTTSGRNPNGGFRNPFDAAAKSGYANDYKTQLFSNIRVRQQLGMLVPGLSFTSMFSFDNFSELGISHGKRQDDYIANGRNPDGSLNLFLTFNGTNNLTYNRFNGGNRRVYTESALNYDTAIGQHRVNALILYNQSEYVDAFAGDFTSSIPYRTRGLAGRVAYSFNDRYFAEYNFGYNGSENFAPSRRYGFFPSYGLGWVVSNERFFEPLKRAIQMLKIRFSDGKVGNSNINIGGTNYRFAYLDQVNTGADGYTFGETRVGFGGINISNYGVNLTWETSHKTNLGFEMNMLHGMNLQVDFFKEHRTGIFLHRQSVPEFVGLTQAPNGNLGIVDNAGIDVTLTHSMRIGDDVKLSLQGTFTYARNKVISTDQPDQKYPWLNSKGHPVLTGWGYVAQGLFKDSSEILNSPQQTFGEVRPGDIKFKDLNGDGVIDAYDRQPISSGDVPTILYGFGFNVDYKGFSLGAFLQGQSHAQIVMDGNSIKPFSGDGGEGNAYSNITDRWTPGSTNPHPFYPRLGYGGPANANNNQFSTWWVKDASFLKVRTAEFAYTFPANTFKRYGVQGARLYFIGTNLATFSKFKLWDVELNTSNGVKYPQVAAYSLGLTLTF